MELTKEKTYGIIGSIIFCIVLFLFLFFTFLRTEIKAKEEGILLHFGSIDLAAGTFTPRGDTPETAQQEANPKPPAEEIPEVPKPKPQPQPAIQQKTQTKTQAKPTPQPITQNREQTAAIEAAKQRQQEAAETAKQKQREKDAAEQAARAEQARLAEEQRNRDAINRQVSGAFGSGTAGRSGQGTGQTGAGDQGNPQGTSTTPSSEGSRIEFNLGGRTLGAGGLPRPAYSAQEEGSIVVDITVDPQGNVINADIGKGTTITNTSMRQSALEAARKTKFSSITGSNNQSGTITYRYSLR